MDDSWPQTKSSNHLARMKLSFHASIACLVAASLATEQLTPNKAAGAIYDDEIRQILEAFDGIARDNNGNRAFGLPGFDASLSFAQQYIHTNDSCAKYESSVQSFSHLFSQTKQISLTGPSGEDVDVVSLQYNNPTPVPDGFTAPLVALTIDDERGSGCFEDQWASVDAAGKIALVKRGGCHFIQVLKLAKAFEASAVIIFNNVPGVTGGSASLGAENYGALAPLGVVTYEQGMEWYDALESGDSIEVNLTIDMLTEERKTSQLFLDTKEGDSDNIILIGAHLDSVQEGAGINDNGSGVAALLAIAKSFGKFVGIKNKLRFAFWGAEESGMIGSDYYVANLPAEELDKIRFYFNYDMIASPSPANFVYANTDSHKIGGQPLFDFLTENGRAAEFATFGSSSDYVGFLDVGIASSGIFTGAGKPYDTCYHTSCDDIANINWEALLVNTKAAAYAAATLALANPEDLPIREQTNLNPRSAKGQTHNIARLADAARGADKRHDCGMEV